LGGGDGRPFRATPTDTKAEVCTDKCPNRKTHNRIIQNNAILKTIKPEKLKIKLLAYLLYITRSLTTYIRAIQPRHAVTVKY